MRDGLLLALTLTSGYLDAIAYLGFDRVFIANMTGNTVLLGVNLGRGQATEALRNAAALCGFAAGALIGAWMAGRGRGRLLWPERVTLTLIVELTLVAIVAAAWWRAGAHPSGGSFYVLGIAGAAAMGVQSAAGRRLAVTGVSTTYVTGTLTILMGEIALLQGAQSRGRQASVLLALCAGAVVGALIALHWPEVVPVPPLALLVIVTITATLRFGPQQVRSAGTD